MTRTDQTPERPISDFQCDQKIVCADLNVPQKSDFYFSSKEKPRRTFSDLPDSQCGFKRLRQTAAQLLFSNHYILVII